MKKSERRWSTDWIGPLFLFLPCVSIAAIYGDQAERLQLPTAWFARTSPLWMLGLVVASFCVPSSPKFAKTLWLMGLSCVAYAPLLVILGSSLIPLSRPLSLAEVQVFRQTCSIPVLFASASDDGEYLRVRHQDDTGALKAYLKNLGALSEVKTVK